MDVMEAKMEELHRTHKDVPFGWVLLMQELAAKVRARKSGDRWSEPAPSQLPGDLHNLSAPH